MRVFRDAGLSLLALIIIFGCANKPLTTASERAKAEQSERMRIRITKPTVIEFYPPEWDKAAEAGEQGANESLAHFSYAMHDTRKCLAGRDVEYRLAVTRILSLHVDGRWIDFKFGTDDANSFGAILAAPGQSPKLLYAPNGPSSMIVALPDAVADYFNAPSCRFNS